MSRSPTRFDSSALPAFVVALAYLLIHLLLQAWRPSAGVTPARPLLTALAIFAYVFTVVFCGRSLMTWRERRASARAQAEVSADATGRSPHWKSARDVNPAKESLRFEGSRFGAHVAERSSSATRRRPPGSPGSPGSPARIMADHPPDESDSLDGHGDHGPDPRVD
jgi:hypothetical protein